jgi:hypothetical protein
MREMQTTNAILRASGNGAGIDFEGGRCGDHRSCAALAFADLLSNNLQANILGHNTSHSGNAAL